MEMLLLALCFILLPIKISHQLVFFTFYFQLIYGNKNIGNIFKDVCQSGDNFSNEHNFVSNIEETNDNYKIILSIMECYPAANISGVIKKNN